LPLDDGERGRDDGSTVPFERYDFVSDVSVDASGVEF